MNVPQEQDGTITYLALAWREAYFAGTLPDSLTSIAGEEKLDAILAKILPREWPAQLKELFLPALRRVWFYPYGDFVRCFQWLDRFFDRLNDQGKPAAVTVDDAGAFQRYAETVRAESREFNELIPILAKHHMIKEQVLPNGSFVWIGPSLAIGSVYDRIRPETNLTLKAFCKLFVQVVHMNTAHEAIKPVSYNSIRNNCDGYPQLSDELTHDLRTIFD